MARNRWRFSKPTIAIGVFGLAVVLLIGLTAMISGQAVSKLSQRPASPHFVGVPDDWTHHHVVFSNPGTYEQVAKDPAAYAKWLTIRYDTRFILQQMKRNLAQGAIAPAPDFATLAGRLGAPISDRWPVRRPPPPTPRETLKRDWSMSLGSNATVGAGQFPAKFSFSTSSANCSDFAVFNTGVAGVTPGQANIVAYSNLYATACGSTVPSVYWAYYSGGGKALTSPVISLDGSKVAFVENPTSGAAILRIIAWRSGQGTPAAAATPNKSYTNTTAGAGGTAWNTTNCPAGDSCMISVAFQDGNQDTTSAPFYVYEGADTIYVGDASGYLHKFTGVFLGTPGEVTTGGWPVLVSSGNALTSPVYDPVSENIFVGNESTTAGYLYSVTSTGTPTVTTSYQLAVSPGILDGPIVDPVAEEVYVFVGEDMQGGNNSSPCTGSEKSASACAGVYQLPTDFTGSTKFSESILGVPTTNTLYAGSFDNLYYTSEGTSNKTPTGNLYACTYNASGYPKLMDAIITTGAFTNESGGALGSTNGTYGNGTFVDASNLANPMTSAVANCSPVTEIYDANLSTPTDWIFLSVSGGGDLTVCSGACIYSWNVTTTPTLQNTGSTPTQATQGLAATGGTSGMIIDNISTSTGASQIYYGLLGSTSCGGNGSTGSGTGGCAVQAAQNGL